MTAEPKPTPDSVISADPMERFIDWLVDATFEQVLKEMETLDL